MKSVRSTVLYRRGEFLKKRVKKSIPIMIIVILLSTSFSPMVFAKKNVDDASSDHPKIKVLKGDTERPVKALLVGFMEKLVERFPKLASLPVFQKLLGNEENSTNSNSDTSEDDENNSQSNTSTDTEQSSNSESGRGVFTEKLLERFPGLASRPFFQKLLDITEKPAEDNKPSEADQVEEIGRHPGDTHSEREVNASPPDDSKSITQVFTSSAPKSVKFHLLEEETKKTSTVELEIKTRTQITATIDVATYSNPPITPLNKHFGMKYINIESDKLNDVTLEWVVIKLYYKDDDVPSCVDEETLRLYWYNEDSKAWEKLSDSGVDAANNFVWGKTNHFSWYAVGGDENQSFIKIPESGHMQISGNISIEIPNGMLEIDNHTILLSGMFYLESENDTVDIWWNISRGFFKINGSRHFEIENLYFDVDGKLVVTLSSLIIIDAQGYFTIDRFGDEGGLFFNGVRELEGLSVSIDIQKENVTFSGSFDLSTINQAKDLRIYWGKDGFSTGGSYNGETHLDIHDFHLVYSDFDVYAGLVSFYSSADFKFTESDETTLCSIFSDDLRISDLYLKYGDKSLFVNSVEVHGVLNLTLHIDGTGDEYVTATAGHITITGNTVMNIDTVVDINGTVVELRGSFMVETSSDSIEIWWNTTQGFFKINCTSLSVLGNFHVSINSSWLDLSWGSLVMNSNGFIIVDKANNRSHLEIKGCTSMKDLALNGDIQGNPVALSVGSIYFGVDGELDLFWNNRTSNVTAYASCDFGLTIHNISFSIAGVSAEVSTVTLQGEWRLEYNNEYLLLTINGVLQISGISLGNSAEDAAVGKFEVGYISASGTVKILIKGGIIELWLSGNGSLVIRESPAGPICLSAHGKLHAIIDLTTGVVYGEFSFGAYLCIMGLSVSITGEGHFYLANGQLDIWVSGSFHASLGFGVGFTIDNLTISAAVGVSAWGSYSVHISINLITGKISMGGGIGGVAIVSISNIRAYGYDINLDEHDWKDLGINESSLLYSFEFHVGSLNLNTHGSIRVVAFFYMGLNGGFGFSIGSIDGDLGWDLDVRDIKVSSNPDKPLVDDINFTLSIDSIDAEGNFSVSVSDLGDSGDVLIKFNGTGEVNNIRLNVMNSSSGGYLNASIGKISLTGNVDLKLLNVLHGLSPGVYENTIITADASASLTIENISVKGEAYNLFGGNLTLGASVDLISLEVGELRLFYSGENNGTLCIEGSGYLTVEGVSVNGNIDGTNIGASVGLANFTLSGYINIYGDGTIEAECEGSLVVEDVTVSIGNEEMTIENINIEFGGSFKVIPGESEDEPPVYEINGHVEWNITGDIESEGNVTVDANVTIQFDRFDDGNFTINITFEGEVNIEYIHLNSTIPMRNGTLNATLNIENYSGSGMFEFYWNTSEGHIYLNNSVGATWDAFNFNIGDGLLLGEIYEFTGDIDLRNLYINTEAIDDMLSTPPQNWSVESETGYESVLGFDFSSNGGLDLEGDVSVDVFLGVRLHVTDIHVDPQSEGYFLLERGNDGYIRVTLECSKGYAKMNFKLDLPIGGGVTLLLSLDSEKVAEGGSITISIPLLMDFATAIYYTFPGMFGGEFNLEDCLAAWHEFMQYVQDTDKDELEESLRDMLRLLDAIEFNGKVYDISEIISWLLNSGIPLDDDLRELLESILEEMEEEENDESCFLAGTGIAMADGSLKRIEDIRVGDLVKSYDTVSGEWKSGVVVKVFHHPPGEMTDYYLVINGELRVTPNHPVYVDGEWVDAGKLKVGDVFGGNVIESIEKVYQRVPTYNFEVEPYHTYSVIWGSGVASVVHNAMAKKNASEVKQVVTGDKHQHKSCFLGGTQIMMADGSLKDIEDIEVGDLVKSYDTVSGEWRVGVVTEVFHHSPGEMTDYYLVINGDLRVTPNHPVYVDGKWVTAEELRVGDVFGGNVIVSIEKVYQRVSTYNFEVEPYHTYNVVWGNGASSIVHNAMQQKNASEILKQAGVSGDKYQSTSVKADAGVKTEVQLSKKVVTNSTKKIVIEKVIHVVPKTYENKKGEKVRVDDISVVVNENGKYNIEKKENGKTVTVKKNLKSSKEVVNYIQGSIVSQNTNNQNNQNSNNNNNNDDEDDDDDDDDDETCCFPAGTMITMADGSLKPIEDVRVGDFVLSYDVRNQRTTVCSVLEKVAPVRAGVYSINNGLVYVTDDHPFYVLKRDGRVGWAAINPEHTEYGYSMSVLPLEVGDKLFTQKGTWVTIQSIVYKPGVIQTYNLEDVSGKSTFFANGLLVHNAVQCKESSETAENQNSNNGGVSYGYYTGVSATVLSSEPLTFEDESDLDSRLTVEFPIEFNGSGTYIADDDKSVNSGKTVGGSGVLPSTKIVMADGSAKYIRSIKVGDLVRSCDPINRRTVTARVLKVSKHATDEMGEHYLIIKFKSKTSYPRKPYHEGQGDGNKETAIQALVLSPLLHGMELFTDGTSRKVIDSRDNVDVSVGELKVTPNHLIYVKTAEGKYKLVAAATVKPGYTLVGVQGELVVSSVQKVFKKSVTYSLKLNRYDAYFADGVLVQNGDVSAVDDKQEPKEIDDNEIVAYIWDFGDGTIGYGKNPRHTFHVDVPLTDDDDVNEAEFCGVLYEGSTSGLRDIDTERTPTGGRASRNPWIPDQPTVTRKPVDEDRGVGAPTSQPTYVMRKVTYPVTLVAVDKYGRIGVDTTEITVTIPIPVPTQPIQNDYLSDVYYKSIEDVKVGEWVKTVDLESKKVVNAKVTEVVHHTASEMNSYYLVIRFRPELTRVDRVPKEYENIDTTIDREYMLEVTPNHPVCVVTSSASSVTNIAYKWVSAGSLKVGDVTYSVTGERIVVSSIQKVYRRVDTYNIKVETYGTYFANGILVQDKTDSNTYVSNVCFLAGTQIATAKGPCNREEINEREEPPRDKGTDTPDYPYKIDEIFSQFTFQSF